MKTTIKNDDMYMCFCKKNRRRISIFLLILVLIMPVAILNKQYPITNFVSIVIVICVLLFSLIWCILFLIEGLLESSISFLDRYLEIDGKTRSGAPIKTSISYSHFQNVFFDNKRTLNISTGSGRLIAEVRLEDYSKDKTEKILERFLCIGKDVSISSQLFSIYSV